MNSKVVRVIGVLGILWNLGGVASYLGYVGVTGGAPEQSMPAWVTGAFAIAVWAGLLGSIGLALLQRWAGTVLWLSAAGAVVDWGWVFAYGKDASAPLGVAVIVVAIVLAVVADLARRRVKRSV